MKFMKRAFGEFHKFHMKWPMKLAKDRLINFIWNDHDIQCKILFVTWPFKMNFIAFLMNSILIRKRILDTGVVNNITYTRQSVITHVVIRFYDMTSST